MVYIDRCVCTGRTFRSLQEEARDRDVPLARTIEAAGAGTHCTTCIPYLRRCLETGQTEFYEILCDPHSDPNARDQPQRLSEYRPRKTR